MPINDKISPDVESAGHKRLGALQIGPKKKLYADTYFSAWMGVDLTMS